MGLWYWMKDLWPAGSYLDESLPDAERNSPLPDRLLVLFTLDTLLTRDASEALNAVNSTIYLPSA